MTSRVGRLVLALLLALPAGLWAQQGTTDLRGQLRDQQGGALPGVTVTVRNQNTGMFRETVSNADGTCSNANFLRLTGLSTSTNPRLVQFGARDSF